jgi:type I restriction enzyme S subunit
MSVPKLRFKEFKGKWEDKKIGSICDSIVPGRNKPVDFDGNIPWITTPDIEQNGIIYDSKKGLRVTKEEAKKVGSKIVPKNSIIISCVGDLGLVAVVGNEIIINQQLHAFIPKEDIYYQFLLYSLSIRRGYMEKVATKTAVPYMNKDNCNSIPISYPSYKEQSKIADFLMAVDEKIAQLTQKCELLARYKKGVMQQIFSQELRFKDDDGSDFPDWEDKKLKDIATRVTRKNKEDNKNVLTISAQQGLINQEEFFNKSVSAKDVRNYYLIHEGEFAYNKSYSNGYPMGAIKCLNRYKKGVVSTLYICFKFQDGNVNSFFEQYFESGLQNQEIEKVAQEGARNHGLLNIGLAPLGLRG